MTKYTAKFENFLRRKLRRKIVVSPDAENLFMVRYGGDDLTDEEIIEMANKYFKRGGLYWRPYDD